MAPGKVALFSTIVIFAVLCFSTAVSGTTYLVRPDGSGDFITIQAAIDAAQDWDVIELSDGTFTGTGNRDIDFKGKAITVRSQSKKPEVCIIDCQASDGDKHRGFIFHSDEGADAVLEYVTIRNGNKNWPGAYVYPDTSAGGAILVRGASPTIRHNIIENNFANDCGGINCREGSNARILHNRILNNTAQDDCGGIGLVNPGNVEVIGNVIFENHSASTGGGMVVHAGDEVIIQDNLFIDNDCMRTDGRQSWGAGLAAGFNSNLVIVNNTFAYNGGDDGTTRYGGGIYALPGSNVWISNSIFYRNSARNEGSAIYCEPGASVTLVCSDVYGNSGGDWVGCIADQDGINGNFCEDPLFCDPTSGDFTLDRSSSCLPGNHPSGEDCGLIGALEQACGAIVGSLDIKPGSCPNPFNIKWLENTDKENGIKYAALKKGGVLPVAIAGSENFDVTEVDVSTLFLEGVAPLRSSLEDVTRPADGGEECACATGGPDGHMDLNLKFSRREIAVVIGPAEHREVVILRITGSMVDGTPFEASDCVTVLGRRPDLPMPEYSDQAQLGPALPNPFNPVTRFVYWLPRSEFVKLSIFDVAGRLVDRIVEEVQPRGEHIVVWDARGLSSGVYFYRLETAGFSKTRKMILLK